MIFAVLVAPTLPRICCLVEQGPMGPYDWKGSGLNNYPHHFEAYK